MRLLIVDSLIERSSDPTNSGKAVYNTISSNRDKSFLIEENDEVARRLLSEILTEDSNPLKVEMRDWYSDVGSTRCVIEVSSTSVSGNVFKRLLDRFEFRDKVEFSVVLNERGNKSSIFIPSVKGSIEIKINRESYSCIGFGTFPTSLYPSKLHSQYNLKLFATIPDDIFAYACLSLSEQMPVSLRVLNEAPSSDVIIVAENGAEIPCHKLFLFVSPVLKAMFQSGMEESLTGRLSMADISEEGVRAFLRYLYNDDLKGPKEDIGIAFELLCAAHKYDLPRLELLVIKCLKEMSDKDFFVEDALKIYLFIKDFFGANELKAKLINILKSNLDELEKLPEYKELFRKRPDDAMELSSLLIRTSSK